MSDTSTPTPSSRGNPQRTSPTLPTVTIDQDLHQREGEETISDVDAMKILETRFAQPVADNGYRKWMRTDPRDIGDDISHQGLTTERHDLLSRIIRMIPIEDRTASVFQLMDIRPILDQLQMSEQQSAVHHTSMRVNDVPVGPDARVEAGKLLAEQNTVIADQAFVLAASLDGTGKFANQAERQTFIDQFVNSYKQQGAAISATPQAGTEAFTEEGQTQTPGQMMATDQIADLPLFEQYLVKTGRIDDPTNSYQFMDEAHLQWMFRMGAPDWNKIIENEAAKAEARRLGQTAPADFLVDEGALSGPRPAADPRMSQHPSYPGMQAEAANTKVRLLDVYNSLFSDQWSQQELRNLQDKLVAGGYMKDEDVRWSGRATDPATTDAWRRLIVDSINTGTDMMTLLKDQTAANRLAAEEENAKNARDIVLTSAVGIRQTANSLGVQTIGRELSQEQQAQLVEYIHNLERTQQTTMNREGSQTVEEPDIEAEVASWIERENSTETGAYDLLNQFNAFNDIARRRG